MRLKACALVCLLALAALIPGCKGNNISNPTTTTTTTTSTTSGPVSKTETFEDSLTRNDSKIHTFHTLAGTVTTTLTSLEPSTFAPTISVAVGTWDGSTCTPVLDYSGFVVGNSLTGTAMIETDLCVKVYDTGIIAAGVTVNYQIQVIHQAASS